MNRVAAAVAQSESSIRVRLKYKLNGQRHEEVFQNVHAANAAAAKLVTGGIPVVLAPVRGAPEVMTVRGHAGEKLT